MNGSESTSPECETHTDVECLRLHRLVLDHRLFDDVPTRAGVLALPHHSTEPDNIK